jgi:iron complex outermembrane recepter protein
MNRVSLLAGVALSLFALPAQAADDVAAAPPQTSDDFHIDQPAEIIITAPFVRNRADVLSGTSVLSGSALARELRPTIGDTLARQPGVSSTSFGPNASRPVLRGFQGERIRVLTDGIGSFDVSNTSVDHAVVINPLLAERIEVLRGPASLLFGSSAIGGVVNVIDKRIPRAVPTDFVHVDAIGSYSSAADMWSGGGSLDLPVAGKIVLHVDGSYLESDDLRIGGFVLSREARAQAAASANPEVRELANLRNRLPSSAARTWDVAGGASVITDRGSLGFAVSRYENEYQIPARFDLETGEGEAPTLDMQQTRVDARADLSIDGFFDRIRARVGYADYQHAEIEEDGEVGTRFFNEGLEGRLELSQAKRGPWQGAIGAQLFIRDFNVVGEEAFVPKNETVQYGLFTLQSFDWGKLKGEVGGRIERTEVSSTAIEVDRTFTALSGSIGASYEIIPAWRLGVNLSHTERAPSAEELFSNGPHKGTQAFEIGDPTLRKERNLGVEAVLRGAGRGFSFELSAYYNRFRNFIYEAQTGEIEDDLPVFEFRQANARYWGIEAQASAELAKIGGTTISIDGVADYVRATIPGVGPVPRIPPLRLLGAVNATADRVTGRVEVEHSFKQDRVAEFETETDAFTLVNASIGVRPWGSGPRKPEILVQANNIFDVDARRHASFLKDFAPLAGRDVRVTLRASF